MEAQRAEAAESGIWRARHLAYTGNPWVYATDNAGRIIAWAEYDGNTGRSILDAEAIVAQALIGLPDPSTSPRPPLRLI